MRILEPTSGATAALVICFSVLSWRAALAQVGTDPQLVQKAQVCADPAQPPAERVRSCTGVIKRAGLAKSAYAATLDERADALIALGSTDEAIADLTQVLRIDPANGSALYNRGIAYQRSGQDDKALDDFRAAAALTPPFAPARLA